MLSEEKLRLSHDSGQGGNRVRTHGRRCVLPLLQLIWTMLGDGGNGPNMLYVCHRTLDLLLDRLN